MKKVLFIYVWLLVGLSVASDAVEIKVQPERVTLQPGREIKFDVQAFDASNQPIGGLQFEWNVVPNGLGRVNNDGVFRAANMEGRGRVIASTTIDGKYYAGSGLVVVRKSIEPEIKISVLPEKAFIEPNSTQEFRVIAKSPDGISLRARSVRWLVRPGTLGEIDRNGFFQAGSRIGMGKIVAIVEIDQQVYRGDATIYVSSPPSASVSGKVVAEDNTPVFESTVVAKRIGKLPFVKRTQTDQEGKYLLENLIPGNYIIQTKKAGYVVEFYKDTSDYSKAEPVELSEDEVKSDINFSLSKGASISGAVMDDEDNSLSDVHVYAFLRLNPRYRVHGFTDENGEYRLEGLKSGSYVVFANVAGYLGEYFDNVRNIDDAELVNVEAPNNTENINFKLGLTSAITGIISDQSTNEPIEGAIVGTLPLLARPQMGEKPVSFSRVVRTNERGEYTLQVKPGIYLVHARAKGYNALWYESAKSALEAQAINVTQAQHVEANISLESLGQITGKITDVKSGNPIEGARVRAFSENRAHKRAFTTVTDKDGLYELTHLPEGEYIIRANAMDYLGEFYENTTDPKEATLVQVENTKSTPDIDFELQKGSIIKGQVTDAITTEPLSDVYVTVRHQDKRFHRTTKTDETGCFELTGLPSGSFLAMAKARNYNVQWYSEAEIKAEATVIELVEDEIKEGIDFRLSEKVQEGPIVSGTVTDDSTDLTIEGATVAVMPLTFARPIRAISGPDGTYELKGLQPGVYLIICRAPGYVAEYYKDAYRWVHAEKIRIHGTENITGIDFSLAPQPEGAYMVSGRVANDHGQSMEGVYIVAEAQDQVIAATTTDSEGEYILNDLPVGEYKITASVSGYPESSSTSQEIQIGNGMQTGTVDIYMPSTPTGVEKNILPNAYKLEQNYPNPFNPTTEIKFILPETAQLKLIIYNILGKPVKTLYDGQHKAGTFAIQWNGRDDQGKKLASGVYIYKMIAQAQGETFIKSYQMLMLK